MSGATDPNAVFPAHQVSAPFKFAEQELDVLSYWKAIDAFQESMRLAEGRPQFSFFDGPPFATGLPHHGHIMMGTVKDIVTRFASTNGFYCERRFGWDTHGLPVEHEIDKKLNIKSKQDVMDIGIDKYNAECRAIVMRYASEWRTTVERLGRWIDFDNDYKTLNISFMESVWWVFGQLWKKDLVYRGMRCMPYTTGCMTPLSNFEAGQDYRDVQDPAVTVSFPLLDDPDTSFLAWTTTPWTLPMNVGLCVHPDLTYVKIFDEEKKTHYILCDKLLGTLYKNPKVAKYKKVAEYKGKDLHGMKYKPLFTDFYEAYKDRGFKVLNDTYVTADSGTGIVHQAPAFGDDDHRVAIREGVIRKDELPPCPIDEKGIYTKELPAYAGIYIKDADKLIMKHLKAEGRLIVQSTLTHSYPFCWRSGTPLIYRVIPVWFVKVEESADRLVKANGATRWVPASVGEKRFTNWLTNARDWNISRNRYWGTPLPLWTSEDFSEIVAISSIEELEELTGEKGIKDLHRESIDHLTIPSKKGNGDLKRVEEVFDCWFESGSMPFAQVHYPFENKENFEKTYPADFISEGIDQTRGWFYTLLVLSTLLNDTAPWKNLIVCGHVLAADGKKMSKSLKNYPDPNLIIDQYGADALRLFLINSPVVRGDSLRFKEEGVKEVITRVLLPFLNSFRFLLGQVALLKKESNVDFKYDAHAPVSKNVMDRWILARCQSLIQWVEQEMAAYRLYNVVGRMLTLLDELTNWYIRFNRRRLKGENGVEDTVAALQTLFETLFTLCRTLGPFIPFLTENIYQGLRQLFPAETDGLGLGPDVRSVHFLPFPKVREEYFDPVIERQVQRLQTVIELGRGIREREKLAIKSPLLELVVFHSDAEYLEDVRSLLPYVEQELNVINVTFSHDEVACGIRYKAVADWVTLGRKLRKDINRVKKGLESVPSEDIKNYIATGKLTIDGIELIAGDLTPKRYVELGVDTKNTAGEVVKYVASTDDDVVIMLDTLPRPHLENQGVARELLNRIQRLRKKAGLVQTDEVDVYYRFTDDLSAALGSVIKEQESTILKVLKRMPLPQEDRKGGKDIVEEEQDLGDDRKVTLALVWPEA